MAVPAVLAIDVEPDGFYIDPTDPSPWRGFEAAVQAVREWRSILRGPGGQPELVWLLRVDPQVAHTYGDAAWVVERYAAQISELRAAGDHFGIHVHGYRWDSSEGLWVDDYADSAWVDECIDRSVDAYTSAFGTAPRIGSMGAAWNGESALERLQSWGIDFDFTIIPSRPSAVVAHPVKAPGRATGVRPGTRHVPLRPHQVDGPMTRVPITVAHSFPAWRRALGRARHGKNPLAAVTEPNRLVMARGGKAMERGLKDWWKRTEVPYLALSLRCHNFANPAILERLHESATVLGEATVGPDEQSVEFGSPSRFSSLVAV